MTKMNRTAAAGVAASLVAVLTLSISQAQTNVGTAFTCQGRLTQSGAPVNGACTFQFSLFDALSGGSQIGLTQTRTNIAVTAGYFTIPDLDFGNFAFNGQARWLQIAVNCGSGLQTLSPRQPVTVAPYASTLRPGALTIGVPPSEYIYYAENTSTSGANASGFLGVSRSINSGRGVTGYAAAITGTTYGVWGQSDSPDGIGVFGLHQSGSGTAPGVYGRTHSTSGNAVGVLGEVWPTSPGGFSAGVYGVNQGTGVNGIGVWGDQRVSGYGVYGTVSDTIGGYAGYFVGRVNVTGNLSKGGGSFKIDHPLDPANKYLYHSFVESPDMKNIYDGVVMLDANGEAWVTLPAWFEALNMDFRYQLTPIGASMPGSFIAEEISGNRFKIAGGAPNKKVSWQVTGTRNDPYAQMYRIPVEENKPANERGTYLHPEAHGQPKSMGLDYQRTSALRQESAQGGDR